MPLQQTDYRIKTSFRIKTRIALEMDPVQHSARPPTVMVTVTRTALEMDPVQYSASLLTVTETVTRIDLEMGPVCPKDSGYNSYIQAVRIRA